MRTTIELLKKAGIAIPSGNLERFGGLEGIAKAKLSSLAAERYVKYYEEISPEEKAN